MLRTPRMHYDHEGVLLGALGGQGPCPWHPMSRPGPRYLNHVSDFVLISTAPDCAARLTAVLRSADAIEAVHRQLVYMGPGEAGSGLGLASGTRCGPMHARGRGRALTILSEETGH